MNDFYDEDDWFEDDYQDPNNPPFANPGGNSALRAGPRIHPCPACGEPNRLSSADVRLGYQCDECADRAEGGGY